MAKSSIVFLMALVLVATCTSAARNVPDDGIKVEPLTFGGLPGTGSFGSLGGSGLGGLGGLGGSSGSGLPSLGGGCCGGLGSLGSGSNGGFGGLPSLGGFGGGIPSTGSIPKSP